MARPFCWYQVQGHLSRSNSKVIVFGENKWPLCRHWCFTNTCCFFFFFYSNVVLCGLTLSQTSPGFYMSAVQVFENTVGKGEIARNEQFLHFPPCFLPVWRAFCHFLSNLKLSSANSFSLEESKICCLVMG